ncbi:MAG: GNAT family N-acetyltransferase [Ignavibacteria bacterium GWF2_33_9]|nr:MAG: GNAT family N-acetyltransferase [Ignavibacteria bacterium GWF2_33_9]
MEVIPYNSSMYDAWEKLVAESNNGTMFHNLVFLDYHTHGKFEFSNLTFWQDGKLLAVLPGGFKENGRTYWSPVGASYGSIVAGDIPFDIALNLVDAMMDYFRSEGTEEIFLIPPPIMYSTNYNQHIEYAMLYRKFDFELHYISHAIDLKHGKDFLKYFDKTARKTIHKILREDNLRIEDSEDYETFNNILLSNKARHDVLPTHSLEDMLRIRDLMPDKVKLMLVYYGELPIAGSWLFLANGNVVLCFYNMLLYEFEHLKPIYLVMYETVRWATENGYKWIDIGVSQDTKAEDPMTPSLGLINFKERFNSRGILRSTFHYKFK